MEFKNNNNKSFTKGEIDDYWRFLPFQYFFFFFKIQDRSFSGD